MPLARGHVLVISRDHHERLGGLGVRGGEEVCTSILLNTYVPTFCEWDMRNGRFLIKW